MRALPLLLLLACGDDPTPAVDAFGQRCPLGTGTVSLTYTVVHDGCFEEVTEDRCRAWWGDDEGGGDMSTWVEEVDRCVQRSQWFGEADYRSDPRVVAYGADTGCFVGDPVPCADADTADLVGDTDVNVDAFGQACPPGGVVTWTYTVVNDGVPETVTEQRCAAWWWASGRWNDIREVLHEVDGRCVELPGNNEAFDRRVQRDPRVAYVSPAGECAYERPDTDL